MRRRRRTRDGLVQHAVERGAALWQRREAAERDDAPNDLALLAVDREPLGDDDDDKRMMVMSRAQATARRSR